MFYKSRVNRKTLTMNKIYEGKVDKNGDFRVKGDDGKWNKYSSTNFFTVSVEEFEEALERVIKDPDAKERVRKAVEAKMIESELDPESERIKRYEELEKKIEDAVEKRLEEKEVVEAPESKRYVPKKESEPVEKKMTIRSFLREQGVSEALIDRLAAFRGDNKVDEKWKSRIEAPQNLYFGGKVWNLAISAFLEGQHILLEGGKATGKNVLASNLAYFFGSPVWDISFHVNTDASSLIGSETFRNNQVEFRPGAVYECALAGGVGVLDEINMAKNEAVAVLHSITDDRRVIDVPGYDRVKLHPNTRFIGTMNYGYAGTRALNEALKSRFVVIKVEGLKENELTKLLHKKFPEAALAKLGYYAKAFIDLQIKAENAEISTSAVDLRGMISALKMTQGGINPLDALEVNIVNKCDEAFEEKIVRDVIKTRISAGWSFTDVFPHEMIKDDGSFTVDFSKK